MGTTRKKGGLKHGHESRGGGLRNGHNSEGGGGWACLKNWYCQNGILITNVAQQGVYHS